MKPRLIVTSHGHLAEEILKSAAMIAGDVGNIISVCMEADDGLEGTTAKMKEAFTECENEPVVIIADLFGGTPFNVANMLASARQDTRVLSGMNLGMIIEYSVSSIEDVNELCDYLISIGQQGITSPIMDDDDDLDIE